MSRDLQQQVSCISLFVSPSQPGPPPCRHSLAHEATVTPYLGVLKAPAAWTQSFRSSGAWPGAQGKTEPRDRARENRADTGASLRRRYIYLKPVQFTLSIFVGVLKTLSYQNKKHLDLAKRPQGIFQWMQQEEGLKKELFSWALEKTQALQRKSQVTVS